MERTRSSFSSEEEVAITMAPMALPSWSANMDTPPVPSTSTLSPAFTPPSTTSARQAVTNDFMFQAEALGLPVVQWRFVFDRDGDPRGANLRARRCKHVNLLRESHVADEEEYLFQAYSVFTVASADFSTAGTVADPYRITLTPAIDNALEPEDLPLAPWS